MALIKCPDCGKEISSRAKSCPNCGCPIAEANSEGEVKIKIPNVPLGILGAVSSRQATIVTEDDVTVWMGEHGQTATFWIEKPTNITIDIGGWCNTIKGRVEPNKKYNCVQDLGIHWKGTYRLSEVEMIDSE